MNIKNQLVRPLYYSARQFFRLNVIKTLFINFKMLPFQQAIKLPIYLYGSIKFHGLRGKVIINAPIERGMIKIGYRWLDLWPSSYLPTQLRIDGSLWFSGWAILSGGVALTVVGGQIKLGDCCRIGAGTTIKAMKSILIDDNTSITSDCILMDCNMHFVKNIETGEIKNNTASISIGKNCWINSRTIIEKGAVIPDYSISSRSSYLNKDYSSFGANLLLVGQPAKPLTSKVQRIFGTAEQHRIAQLFKSNDATSIFLEPGLFFEGDDLKKSHKEY